MARGPSRAALRNVAEGGTFNQTTAAERRDFAASLTNAATTLLQRNRNIPANGSAEVSGGTSFDVGTGRIGVLAALGYSNSWSTRDALQQTSNDPALAGTPQTSFRTVTTDNRIILNGMFGLGANFGEHQLRWTNLFIRDTLKQGRLAAGFNRNVTDQDAEPAAVADRTEHLLVRAPALHVAVRRRVRVRQSQRRSARRLRQCPARIAL